MHPLQVAVCQRVLRRNHRLSSQANRHGSMSKTNASAAARWGKPTDRVRSSERLLITRPVWPVNMTERDEFPDLAGDHAS